MDDQEAFDESLKVAEQRRVFRVVTLQRLLRISYMQAMRCIDRMLAENRVAALSCETGGLEYHFISPNKTVTGSEAR